MTWEDILSLEPRIGELPSIAKNAGRNSQGDMTPWYTQVKRKFLPLIGDGRDPPEFNPRPLPNLVCMGNPDLTWNVIERIRLIAKENDRLKPLYGSHAYDVVYEYLLNIYESSQP